MNGTIRAYWKESKYESLRMLRAPSFAGPFLAMPAALYALFGVVLFGPALAKDQQAAMFTFLGFATMGVMGPGLFGFGMSLATEREQGVLQLKRALPMPAGASMLGKVLMSMVFVAIIMVSMAAVAPAGHVKISVGQMTVLAGAGIFGSVPFCAIGLFVGSLVSAKSAPAFVNLFYLPMIYLSGILFPLPKSMQWIELGSPAYHLLQTSRAAMGMAHDGSAAVHLAVLAGVTVVFAGMALRKLERAG
jgi:ABC-2 type transport system permease protein